MIISLIVAMSSSNRGIGKDNKLLWHLPSDLKLFKQLTLGHCLVVGRKTFASIGRPLPGRTLLVITRNKENFSEAEGVRYFSSLDEAIQWAKEQGEKELFVAGGEQIYDMALPLAQKIYLTVVDCEINADTFFPVFEEEGEWELKEEKTFLKSDSVAKDPYSFSTKIYEKCFNQGV